MTPRNPIAWTKRLRRLAAMALLLAVCTWMAPAATNEIASLAGEEESLHVPESITNSLGSWIWAKESFNGQVCQFWRTFEIPASTTVWKARLLVTADNEYVLSLDGRELGRGAEWRELFDYDLTPLMSPGRHVLAVKARNSFSFAGMLFGLRIDLADGRRIEVKSDENWLIVPDGARGWEKSAKPPAHSVAATIMALPGAPPWTTTPINVNAMPTLYPIEVNFWQKGWFQITLLSVCGVVLVFSSWLMAQLALHRKERLLLQRERARIAMDIHDDLGARMTQLVLHGEVVQSELPDESSLRPQLDLVCQEARQMLSTLDEILWAVNPRCDTLSDFCSYVCSYAEEYLKPTGILGLFDVDPEMEAVVLDLPVRRTLSMAIKETLNNAVKYSEATELSVQIKCRGRKLTVVVQDNGKGFDRATVGPGRNGLSNLSQRMRELGGECIIMTAPGKGCRTEFSVALTPPRQRLFERFWRRNEAPTTFIETNGRSDPSAAPPTHDAITH